MNDGPHNAQTVLEILRQEIPLHETQSAWQVTGPIFSTTSSKIFQATKGPGQDPVAIKCTSPEEAKEQFDALKKTAEILANIEHCLSPEPIALLETSGILMMDWIDGSSFQRMCLNRGTPRKSIKRGIVQCAEILAALHRPSRLQPNTLDTADFMNDIDLALHGREPPRSAKSACAFLQEAAIKVAEETLPVAVLHGDFKSANLLLKNSDIFTIDAAMKWEGATVHDAAHFLNQFALDLYHPKAWRLRPMLNDLEALFLTTYEAEGGSISRSALQWLRLQKLIILYTEHYNKNSITSNYLSVCLKAEIRRVPKGVKS